MIPESLVNTGAFPCYLNDANTLKEVSVGSSPTVQESLGDLLKNNNVIIDNSCYYAVNNVVMTEIFIPFRSSTILRS